jgi:hypothetical protein
MDQSETTPDQFDANSDQFDANPDRIDAKTETTDTSADVIPFDRVAFYEKQRPDWELKNVFWVIYHTVQTILRKYSDDVWKPLSDAMYLTTIDSSNGDPKTSFTDEMRVADLGWFYGLLEQHYGQPGRDMVTCAQWQKYVGITNAIARIVVSIKQYKRMRKAMPHPKSYISVSFREPIPCIGREKYLAGLKKCLDYTSDAVQKYPYFA